MEHSQNFISISYSNIDFLIQKDTVETAFSCLDKDFVEDENQIKKINFLSQQLICIDLDDFAINLNQYIENENAKKCIVLNLPDFIEGEERIALISSGDCRVKNIEYKSFSLFSKFYDKLLKTKGILACSFNEENFVSYLIDIELFLHNLERDNL